MLWACAGSGVGKGDDLDDTEVIDTDPGETDAIVDDEALVRALIAGDGEAVEVLATVAWRGGWPVATADGTWLVVAEGEGLSIAGDFNGWTPASMVSADGWSWAEIDGEGGYKLVDGEAYAADPWARASVFDAFGRLSLVEPPVDRAHLLRWRGLEGRGLRSRDLEVWVPEGDGPWSAVLAHDGQNLFDPGAVGGGWRLADALDGLDLLVVSLSNTPDRMSEYVHVEDEIDGLGVITPLGDAYADLVVLDVLPWAEARFDVDGRWMVMGSSLGGLVSLHTAQRHPEAFEAVASLSGTLGWGRFGRENVTMQERWVSDGPAGVAVYADSGGGPGADGCEDPDGDGSFADDPDATDNYCTTRAFVDALAASGWTWEVDLAHWWEEDAPHHESAWAARVHRPLVWFAESLSPARRGRSPGAGGRR